MGFVIFARVLLRRKKLQTASHVPHPDQHYKCTARAVAVQITPQALSSIKYVY